MKKLVSKPFQYVVSKQENEFQRADIEFHGVDHSGDSFEGRVFLNNPRATINTKMTDSQANYINGYVGSFYVFAHGGCFGDVGHCDVPKGPRRVFDKRRPHPLTPIKKRVTVSNEMLKKASGQNNGEITVTVVPVVRGDKKGDKEEQKDALHLKRISLVTYD